MPLKLIRDDITKLKVDAIVNAANPSLLGGGGVDGAIHAAAGPELLAECRTLGGCRTGEAKLTKGYNLPSRYVIHTVGPVYEDGKHGEEELLRACYRHSLEIAAKEGFETVAFPLISSGVYGYPKAEALSVAVNEIANFLMTHELTVSLVIFDRRSYEIGSRLFPDMEAYIDDHYVEAHPPGTSSMNLAWTGAVREEQALFSECVMAEDTAKKPSEHRTKKPAAQAFVFQSAAKKREEARDPLQEALSHLDESFSEMLLRKIDEKGMTDAECYKKANLDRKHFSKIRSDRLYKPKKPTVIAFAVALRLTLDETKEMLEKAGFALSKSSKFDVIVEYFLMKGEYDVFKINEALFCYDQPLLGAG